MASDKYTVILEGTLKPGHELVQVQARMASLFRTDVARIEQLFRSAPTVIKRGVSQQAAVKYQQVLEQAGALCRIEPEHPASQPAPPPVAKSSSVPPTIPVSGTSKPSISQQVSSPDAIPENTTLYRGQIPHAEVGFYRYVVWPFVKVKNAFESVFNVLFGMIWEELMGKQPQYGQVAQFIAFLIFSGAAFVSCHIPEYCYDILLWIGIALWVFDRVLAKQSAFQSVQHDAISLRSQQAGRITWKRKRPDGDVDKVDFEKHELDHIAIVREPVEGGAFHETVDMAWNVYLALSDGAEFLLNTGEEVMQAVRDASKVGRSLHIPVMFAQSEGGSSLAAKGSGATQATLALRKKLGAPGKISVKKDEERISIFSTWNLRSVLWMGGKVFQTSGFLLFLLIMEGVLFRYGILLNWMLGPYLGIQGPPLYLDLSFSGILSFFTPEGGWLEMMELAAVIGLMLSQGWKMSRQKCLTIDGHMTTYDVGRKTISQLLTPDLEFPLFISEPEPLLIIMDQKSAIEIADLQTTYEFRTFMSAIEEGMRQFGVVSHAKGEQE